ncbi:MAG: hypothetical protein M3Z04_17000 [Chloroflexota bacterium]|nr:hypothetical protein [Chloroflexota bacterium]
MTDSSFAVCAPRPSGVPKRAPANGCTAANTRSLYHKPLTAATRRLPETNDTTETRRFLEKLAANKRTAMRDYAAAVG